MHSAPPGSHHDGLGIQGIGEIRWVDKIISMILLARTGESTWGWGYFCF
jgi:hypothetical protein